MHPRGLTIVSVMFRMSSIIFSFFCDSATTDIYTLSLHDALPILAQHLRDAGMRVSIATTLREGGAGERSEEHTSELQSRQYLVCRLLLEKKKKLRSPARGALPAARGTVQVEPPRAPRRARPRRRR